MLRLLQLKFVTKHISWKSNFVSILWFGVFLTVFWLEVIGQWADHISDVWGNSEEVFKDQNQQQSDNTNNMAWIKKKGLSELQTSIIVLKAVQHHCTKYTHYLLLFE